MPARPPAARSRLSVLLEADRVGQLRGPPTVSGSMCGVGVEVLEAEAMEGVALAKLVQQRTARLMEQNRQLRRARRLDRCPVCREPASILDWRPSVPWLVVDGCRCDGFFLWTALLDTLLRGLPIEDRAMLSARIQSLRQTGKEAWLLTDDDTAGGALVLSDERPEHVT